MGDVSSRGPAAFPGGERPDTGSVQMSIPLLNLPGRGLDVNLTLYYDSAVYKPSSTTTGIFSTVGEEEVVGYGFALGYGMILHPNAEQRCYTSKSGPSIFGQCPTPPAEVMGLRSTKVYIDHKGAKRLFNGGVAADGSDLKFSTTASGYTVSYPDGTTVYFGAKKTMVDNVPTRTTNGTDFVVCRDYCDIYSYAYYPVKVVDRNGNFIAISYNNNVGPHINSITDTLGRVISFRYKQGDLTIVAPGFTPNTEREVARFYFKSMTRANSFQNQPYTSELIKVIDYLYLPGTRAGWHFDYSWYGMFYRVEKRAGMAHDPATGELTDFGQVIATTEYNYDGTPNNPTSVLPYIPKYTTRTDTWQGSTVGPMTHNFNVVYDSNARTSRTEITAPDGTFTEITRPWLYLPPESAEWAIGLPAQVKVSKGGKIYSQIDNDWIEVSGRARLRAQEITNDAGQKKRIEYQYQNNSLSNISEVKEFGFDGVLIKREVVQYQEDSKWTNRWLVRLPKSIKVFAGAATTPISQVDYDYDGEALSPYTSPPVMYDPNTPQERGNVTRTSSYTNAATPAQGATVISRMKYDIVGNVIESIDPNDKVSTVAFGDAFSDGENRNTYAYPTSASSAIPEQTPGPDGPQGSAASLTTSTIYNFNTGLVVSTTDANSRIISYEYDDPINRVKKINLPDGGWTSYEYQDGPGVLYVKTQTKQDDSTTLSSYQYFDGLGRTVRVQNLTGEQYSTIDTEYDVMGRASRGSNSYLAALDGTPNPDDRVWSSTSYDPLGRVSTVTTPDGAQVKTEYDGARVLVTDQMKRQRVVQMDTDGRVTDVWEIKSADAATESVTFPGHPEVTSGYRTSYTYDVLGNMRQVKQGAQRRYFAYDSLSRLIRVKLPEQDANASLALSANLLSPLSNNNNDWSASYEYEPNGNLHSMTDARGVKSVYKYDRLDRIIKREYVVPDPVPANYTVTPASVYFYDGTGLATPPADALGRLSAVTSGSTSYRYTGFDVMGRVKSSQQEIDGQTYTFADYSYDLIGNLRSQTYPSGRTVATEYDAGGRIAGVKQAGGAYYAGSAATDVVNRMQYTPHGALKVVKLGNNLWEQVDFNTRYQPERISLGSAAGSSDVLKLEYNYKATESDANDGNVRTHTITLPGMPQPLVQTYNYDQLNRLQSVQETSSGVRQWIQTFKYDPYGNRNLDTELENNQPKTTDTLIGPNPQISESSNRIVRRAGSTELYLYDEAGNMVRDQYGHAYKYDANNRQAQYFHVANPMTAHATYTYDGQGRRVKKVAGGNTTRYIYDTFGKLIAEYSTLQPSANGTRYVTTDRMGSPRVVTDAAGAARERHDYLPFGEQINTSFANRYSVPGYNLDHLQQKFTGYERDFETGLDYAQARYYGNSYGRFTSVDPLITSAKNVVPQSWNRYAYCGNNPIICADPTGLDWDVAYRGGYAVPIWNGKGEGTGNWNAEYGYIFWSPVTGTYVVLNPFEPEHTQTGSREAAQRAFEGYKFQAAMDYAAGHAEAISMLAWGGRLAFNVKINENSEMYRRGAKIGLMVSLSGAAGGGVAGASTLLDDVFKGIRGIAGEAVAYERKHLLKHIAGTAEAAKEIRGKQKAAHVFNDLATLSRVEAEILSRGIHTGTSPDYARFGLYFDEAIGYRIGRDGSKTPLHYAEMKISPDGLYHIIPRTGPRSK
jgi:RHS repeat-associated protein